MHDEPWVDALLETELGVVGKLGLCCLAYLLQS